MCKAASAARQRSTIDGLHSVAGESPTGGVAVIRWQRADFVKEKIDDRS
jgi:hypothetical protein